MSAAEASGSPCKSCGFENPTGLKLCGGCGASLAATCSSCGTTLPAGFRFCGQCGAALEDVPAAADSTQAAPGERRQVTVLFCDLVRFTELSSRLDPEELREVIAAYQHAAASVVTELEGHVAQYLGDGLLVYFGYPVAHEDDPRRAVRAALGIIEALAKGPMGAGVDLEARVGVHTGPVVAGRVGAAGRWEQLALGPTPNIGARLQALAAPGQVVVSPTTRGLTQRHFEFESLGLRALKGVPKPMEVFRVLRELPADHARRQAPSHQGQLVGREDEHERLHRALAAARSGRGRSVAIVGEAGIGKSHLATSLRQAAHAGGARILDLGCSPYHSSTPLHPLRPVARRLFTGSEEEVAIDLGRVHDHAEKLGLHGPHSVAALAPFFGLETAAGDTDLSPAELREARLDALLRALVAHAGDGGAVLLAEDLHWADPTTIELLQRLLAAITDRPLLVLFTSRSLESLPRHDELEIIELRRLGPDAARRLISALLTADGLPERIVEHIIDRADGVPLFLQELTRAILESAKEGAQGLEATDIPSSLQDSMNARLDRLGEAREIAQLAAVIGREFDAELLAKVSEWEDDRLQLALSSLVEAELLQQRGAWPAAQFIFRHALIRDAAYAMLLRRVRKTHHERIATVLEEHFADRGHSQPEVLAHHWGAAQRPLVSARHWQTAGERALRESANLEAMQHLRRGLEALERVEAGPERDECELGLQSALTGALIATEGYTSPQVEATNKRKLELCERLGAQREKFWTLLSLATHRTVTGDVPAAIELTQEMHRLAIEIDNDDLLAAAHASVGSVLFYAGRFAESEEHVRTALELDPEEDPAWLRENGCELRVSLEYFAALTSWMRGQPDTSALHAARAVQIATDSRHAYSVATALKFQIEVAHYRRDVESVARLAAELAQLAGERGFPVWSLQAALYLSWSASQADVDVRPPAAEVLAPMQQALEVYRQAGIGISVAYYTSLLAEVHMAYDQWTDAAEQLDAADTCSSESGDLYWLVEIRRLRALVAARLDAVDPERFEDLLAEALELARGFGARSLELRVVCTLARERLRRGGDRRVIADLLSELLQTLPEARSAVDRELADELGLRIAT